MERKDQFHQRRVAVDSGLGINPFHIGPGGSRRQDLSLLFIRSAAEILDFLNSGGWLNPGHEEPKMEQRAADASTGPMAAALWRSLRDDSGAAKDPGHGRSARLSLPSPL